MFQQSILDSLEEMGFGSLNWNELSNLTPESISSVFQQHYNLTEENIPSALFQSISPEMLQGARYSSYAPQVQAKGQSMLSDLQLGLGGEKAKLAAGGFSGSGGFKKQQEGVKDVYGKSMTDTLSSVRQQQSKGINLISDLISQWHSSAQRIRGIQ